MSYDEAHVRWSWWWVLLWAVNTAILVAGAFVLPIEREVVLTLLLFGAPEAIGLIRHKDALPPLTFVIRRYVPRWLTFTAIRGLLWAATAWGLGMGPRVTLVIGGVAALDGWFSNHFDVTYDR